MRNGDRIPGAASRPSPPRLLLGAVLAGGLAWTGACASVSQPQVAADLALPPPLAGPGALEAGPDEETLAPVEQARASDTANRVATVMEAYALIGPGPIDDAEGVFSIVPDVSGALLLSGRLAEDRHDWETAMASYEALPANHPQRTSTLLRAKRQWRNSNLSMCAQQVFVSPLLTRAELAVLLVSLAPQLESVGTGRSPVLSDILDLPCYREVLTAARCDLLAFDRLEHRFFPFQAVRPEEVRGAVEVMCRILEIKPPVWCHGEEVTAGCAVISMPVRGEQVAELVSRLTETE